jgi:hypothetical protein
MKRILFSCFVIFLLTVSLAFAHQPRIEMNVNNSESNPIMVPYPEISKAYYGELRGQPDYYEIVSDKPFNLYVNILVPNIPEYNQTRLSVEVRNITKDIIAFIDGNNSDWKEFFEEFGQDSYMMGPETRMNVSKGIYYIKVFNANNTGRYSLAVGEEESFPIDEIIKSSIAVPILKITFFNKPFYTALFNIAGVFWLFVIIVLLILFSLVRYFRKHKK